jgi:hypothetical protein
MLATLAWTGANGPAVRTCFAQEPATSDSKSNGPARGPLFVPVDSWIYPALMRLAALGYIRDQATGMRPWTREECIRQLLEAERIRDTPSEEAARLIGALRQELARDRGATDFVEIESVYTRYLGVAGTPLIDGYNFGQTVIDDYGRPSAQGANGIGGFSVAASAGRISFYARTEYWRAPPFASPAASLQSAAPQIEPVLFGAPTGVDRVDAVEAYAGIQLGRWSVTVGKQDLWWGPGVSSAMSLSNDAQPFYSFRVTNASPLVLPGPLKRLGSFRVDLMGGELSGHLLPPRPLLNGQKLTWIVGGGLELGFTRWSLFGGAGTRAFTVGTVLRNFTASGATYGDAVDPGDRKSGFDFLWRPPLPGKPVTIYADLYADDEPSPLSGPQRSGFAPGVYFARIPGLPRWDLRVEAPSTRMANSDQGGKFLYWNNVYHDANTNSGYLLGSWVGRDGRGLSIESTWWRSARSNLQFAYRQNRIGPAFLPGGGTQDDASVAATVNPKPDWTVRGSLQYERHLIPLLGGIHRDLAASLELNYAPHWRPFQNRGELLHLQ